MRKALMQWLARLQGSAFALPLAIVVAALLVAISELGYQQASRQLTDLVVMGQTRLELARVVRRVGDAESSQRGFLLTGRADYLAPYHSARSDADTGLQTLRTLYQQRREAVVEPRLADLDKHVRTKLSEMDEVLALYQAGRTEAARELTLTDIGRDEMVSIRAITETLLAKENERVAVGLQLVFDSLTLNRVGIAAVTAMSLLVLGMYLRQRRWSDLQRQQQQLAVRTERDRLELEVRHRTAELTNLARHLETAREDERARLARDLHDELGALLTAAKLDVARMRPKMQQSAPDLLPRVTHLVETLNSGIALKRRIIEDLRPSTLSNLGLLPALEILCSEFAERLQVQLDTAFTPVVMTAAAELTAFRLVQESLNNIAKHAGAKTVRVSVVPQQGMACISVSDDGVGFEMAQVGLARHGLVGMRYRVQAEGGQLSLQSAPGEGTRVQALLPLQQGGGAAGTAHAAGQDLADPGSATAGDAAAGAL